MILKQHYTRASSLDFLSHHSAIIIAPALAGYLYKYIGLQGIWIIDIITFMIAIFSVILVRIPQPPPTKDSDSQYNFWQDLGYGLRYLKIHKSLLALCHAERSEASKYIVCHAERSEASKYTVCHAERSEASKYTVCHAERSEASKYTVCHAERSEASKYIVEP